jgi:hypothetical protein
MSERKKEDFVKRKGGNVGILDSPLAAKLLAVAVAALASWSGYDEYQDRQVAAPVDVVVNVESMPGSATGLSRESVEALITKAIARQHKANLAIFKQKEDWEKP